MRLIPVTLLAIGIGSLTACADITEAPPVAPHAGAPLGAEETLATAAVVRYVPIEGGCWALETPHGRYAPAGLPASFRQDGLEVDVVVRGAPDLLSICMIAPIVLVDSIRLR